MTLFPTFTPVKISYRYARKGGSVPIGCAIAMDVYATYLTAELGA